jgi:hypothetical protein
VLNIPLGARAIGMGEAYTALADDAASMYWNPAGVSLLRQSEASFLYNQVYQDQTYNNVSVAVPVEYGGFGASVSHLSYGDIEAFDAMGSPAGDVNANTSVGTLSGAFYGNTWGAGINIKGIQQRLADESANAFAADFGAALIIPKSFRGETLRAAFSIRNLGSSMKFIEQEDPLPRQWRIGVAALQMLNKKFSLSMDYGQERNSDGALYFGGEYWVLPYIALRTGYAEAGTEGNGLRAGIGLKFRNLGFDYAFSQYGDLGLSHLYELSMRFGPVQSRLTPEERALFRRAKLALSRGRYDEATQLFDALLELVPHFRPAQRLVQVAMAGYEKQEKAMNEMTPLVNLKKPHVEDFDEVRDLENLLTMTEQHLSKESVIGGRTQEKSQ